MTLAPLPGSTGTARAEFTRGVGGKSPWAPLSRGAPPLRKIFLETQEKIATGIRKEKKNGKKFVTEHPLSHLNSIEGA